MTLPRSNDSDATFANIQSFHARALAAIQGAKIAALRTHGCKKIDRSYFAEDRGMIRVTLGNGEEFEISFKAFVASGVSLDG